MQDLAMLLTNGELSPELRIWSALAPALVICAWFVVGMCVFLVRSALWGVPRDPETLTRGGSILVSEFLRHYFFWLLRPVLAVVVRSGVPPTAITTLSLLFGLGSGAAAAAGRFALAGWLFIFSGALDTLDGRLARLRGKATPWGAAIDSSLDRWTDSAVLIGLAWYYRDSWVLLACLLALMGSSLVPYIRARGEGLGVSVRGGLMQRAERVMYLGVGVALSPVLEALLFPGEQHPMHWLAVGALVALAATSNYTAVVRLLAVVRALQTKAGLAAHPVGSHLARVTLNMAAAAVATVADFCVAMAVVGQVHVPPAIATAIGCVLGATVNFGLNRVVTFRSRAAPLPQVTRYALVSATSLMLNAGGVSLLLSLPAMAFPLAWCLVRSAVFLLWNYPLHTSYVFGEPGADCSTAAHGPITARRWRPSKARPAVVLDSTASPL
jgi:phosphatidylglycerophosphate synthase